MSEALSNLIVGFAIAVSACYCVWRLGPRRMKDALRARLSKLLPGIAARSAPTGACTTCEGCALRQQDSRANR